MEDDEFRLPDTAENESPAVEKFPDPALERGEPLFLDAEEPESLFLGDVEQERKKTETIDTLLNTAFEALQDMSNYYNFFGLSNFTELTEENKEKINRKIDTLTRQAKQEWGRTNLVRLDEFNKTINKIKANFSNQRAKEKEIDAPLREKLMQILEARLLTYLDDYKIDLDEHYTLYKHALHLRILNKGDEKGLADFDDWVKRIAGKVKGEIYDLKKTFLVWLEAKQEKFFIDSGERLTEIAAYYFDLKSKSRFIATLEEIEPESNASLLDEVTALLKELGKPPAPGLVLFEQYGYAPFLERGIISEGAEVEAYYIDELQRIARNEYYLTDEEFNRFIDGKKIKIRQIPICNFLVSKQPLKRIQLFKYEELILNTCKHWSLALENFRNEVAAIRIHDGEMADALEAVLLEEDKFLAKRNLPEVHFQDYRIQKCMEKIVQIRLNKDTAFLPGYKLNKEFDFGDIYIGEEPKKEILLLKNRLAFDEQPEKNGFIYQVKIKLDEAGLPFALLLYNGKQATEHNLYGNENVLTVMVDAEQAYKKAEFINQSHKSLLTVHANDGWINEALTVKYNLLVPGLDMAPNSIDFGEIYIGEDIRKRTIQLTNPGRGDHFDIVCQLEGNLEFIHLSTAFIRRLEQGKEVEVILDCREAFAAAGKLDLKESNPFAGALNILTNNGLNTVQLPVSFTLKKPELILTTNELDFGKVKVGDDPYVRSLTLSNRDRGTHSDVKLEFDAGLLPGLTVNKSFIKRIYKNEEIILTLDPSAMHLSHNTVLQNGINEFTGSLTITSNNGLSVQTVRVCYGIEYLTIAEKGDFNFGAVLLGSKVKLEYDMLLPEKGNLKVEETFPQMQNIIFHKEKKKDRYTLSAVVDVSDLERARVGTGESAKVLIKSTAGIREIPVSYKVFYSRWFTLLKNVLGVLAGAGAGLLALFAAKQQPDNAASLVLYILLFFYGYRRYKEAALQQRVKVKLKPFAALVDTLVNLILILYPPVVIFLFYNLGLQPLTALLSAKIPLAGKAGVLFYFITLGVVLVGAWITGRIVKKHKKKIRYFKEE